MTTSVDLTPDLQAWLRLADLDLIQGSQTNDNRTIIWNKGGEVRNFIGLVDDWYVVTSSDRMGPETYDLAAESMQVIEKYLYGELGSVVRGDELPSIRAPFERDELRPGYDISKVNFAGRERRALIDHDGRAVAIAAVDRLVELSHYLDASVDAIKNSYLSADGKPLFGLWSDIKNTE
ncbi:MULTISPECIES: TNT antitoxin family protein [Mycobacterium]|uniref:TNT antitoxin family protein n=1 Tax=Mycobacterium TaxID=1763 RepID=UPI001CD97B1E|nr:MULTISPECIES: TNT antitoxin family protein [Mycobacterium]MCA2243818.1 TNT antitoxin family protein [Mycobacterium sp. WUMAC-067]MCA2313555.1 TNT antitoxin family protein [Mycobacterium sp. WUMAC-025]MEE3754345.1 TNT antitoxin family protein [Mycobacterium intracellulare]